MQVIQTVKGNGPRESNFETDSPHRKVMQSQES